MATATLTSKGQLVIPKPIRDYLHLHPGDTLDFLVKESGEVLMRPAIEDVRSLKGVLYKPGRKPVSLDAMRQAVRQRGGAKA
jgi:AbrB family looped-hinge helix DNA binding protein